jgi:hypothetical protein
MVKKRWQKIKKDLPKNWAQEVSKTLTDNGFEITATQVSDVKNGRIKNIDMSKKVFQEINNLKILHKKKLIQLKSIL